MTSRDGRLTLTFPPGALSAENEIVIETTDPDALPSEFQGLSAGGSYDLGPDGLTFDQPITVTFNIGDDPRQPDGSLAMALVPLLTAQNGAPIPLGDLRQDVDPGTGLSRVTGTLGHFSPLLALNEPAATRLRVTGVPDQRLPADATFAAVVSLDFRAGESRFIDQVRNARYSDRSFDPIVCQSADCRAVALAPVPAADLQPDETAFAGSFQYGCSGASTAGRYAADVEMDAAIGADAFRMTVGVSRLPLDCTDSADGAEETARIGSLGTGTPGPAAGVAFPFTIFDEVSIPVGGEPPDSLIAAYDGHGSLLAFDDKAVLRDSIFLGGDYRFGLTPLRFDFTDGGGHSQRQEGVILIGADGAVFVHRATNGGFTMTQTLVGLGNVTDVVGYGDGRAAVVTEFSGGQASFYRGNPATGVLERDETLSGAINNAAVGGEAMISTFVANYDWDDAGDIALVTTTPNPPDNTENGHLWACWHVEGSAGQVRADCQAIAELGLNPQKVRCAPTDAEGNTVCAVPSFDSQRLDLLKIGLRPFGFNMTRLDPVDNAQVVEPALTRDGDNVEVLAADADEDTLIGIAVAPDGTETVVRKPTPEAMPPSGNPEGAPLRCTRPSRLAVGIRNHLLLVVGEGDPSGGLATLLLIAIGGAALQ